MTMYVAYEQVATAIAHCAQHYEVSPLHAKWFADALVQTSLDGIDTHGIRLLPIYLRELREGRANPKPDFRLAYPFPAFCKMAADDALGVVAGVFAADRCVELAQEYGVGVVSVGGSNHFGAASVYGRRIAAKGMAAIVMTSAAARMAPAEGRKALFGTNPICFVAPGEDDQPFILDMATSQISYSQIKHYRRHRKQLPIGWAKDAAGNFTTDSQMVDSLAPLGGYKGQGLAMMVEILSGVLAGMPADHELTHLDEPPFDTGRKIGHFILALRCDCSVQPNFFQTVTSLLRTVRACPPSGAEPVLVAGDPQRNTREERMRNGIPLLDEDYRALIDAVAAAGWQGELDSSAPAVSANALTQPVRS